ncbi:patatin-like phospholipase family protein [Actibacterium sp. 188UL27-1]|uniref:patatin-like phospholipase family protein n=1 Tax=Actibacterium sp. 188UL27-1 TaxID=2786961 RepID=UPI00351C5514
MSVRQINLALQGGGAHGAFTWGVLDRLLEDEEIEVAAISGTSAGALNGAAFKSGMISDGRDGAKAALDALWTQVGAKDDGGIAPWMQPFLPSPAVVSQLLEMSPGFQISDAASRVFSPYGSGPLYKNPLTDIVAKFDYDEVCSGDGPEFFVSATNVRNGKIRVFRGLEITPDVIMASACLPTLFRAVEIKDPRTGAVEAYWDGGYTGNPALFPLFEAHLPDDVVVVNINPLCRPDVPRTAQDIQNRINEISFNTSLLRELRAINFVRTLIAAGKVKPGTMKDVLIHMIADDDLMNDLSVATKLVPTPYILDRLKKAGRRAASNFLEHDKAKLGRESSIDLRAMFD